MAKPRAKKPRKSRPPTLDSRRRYEEVVCGPRTLVCVETTSDDRKPFVMTLGGISQAKHYVAAAPKQFQNPKHRVTVWRCKIDGTGELIERYNA